MSKFQLRDYQSECIEALESSWAGGINRPVAVLPTGAGKTVVFSSLIERHVERLRKEGKRVLVVAHREELLEQAEEKIKKTIEGVWTTIVKGSRGQNTHQFADVVIASVQTLARPKRRESLDRIGMVIIDECHRAASASYQQVMQHYGCMDDTPTVGFTATLTRVAGGLPDVWQSVAYSKKIHWMIKEGYLVPPVAKSIEVPGLNLSNIRIIGGDLDAKGLAVAFEDSQAFKIMAEQWNLHAAERPTIAFMPNVSSCHQLQEAVKALGARAEVITGQTSSSDRKAAYARFNSGQTRMLVSAMVLTEGFDAPQTSCVLIGRPTKNPGLYIQAVGRGLRLHPGKEDCLILDLAGASLTHNLAGVNDLESDCESAICDCNCLSCGCTHSCKCARRQCGCSCIEQHERKPADCPCAGGECGCGCPGEAMEGIGETCSCKDNPACECRAPKDNPGKEVDAEILRTLTEVDILGTEIKRSGYTWLETTGGIKFLVTGNDECVFLLPAPEGGYFQGHLNGLTPRGTVKRLDSGALPVAQAFQSLEVHADMGNFTYSDKGASWRRTPASDGQVRMLRGMKVKFHEVLRKGEASDLLSIAKVSRALDPRFAEKYPAKESV